MRNGSHYFLSSLTTAIDILASLSKPVIVGDDDERVPDCQTPWLPFECQMNQRGAS